MGHIIPVIMCGGAGTRLWPVSRESMPKQFVPLLGAKSTFQQVVERIRDPDLFARPIIITLSEFRFIVAEQLREIDAEAEIVLEPMRRDSGPTVTIAALLAAQRDRDAVVLVLAADHVIRMPDAFRQACKDAAVAASAGRIVTFGVKPTAPVTGYGYIRPGQPLNGSGLKKVEAFVEKPDRKTAEEYVADGFFWNSGNFLFHAGTMLREIERFEPAMADAVKTALANVKRDLDFIRLPAESFRRAPTKSIDFAVLERTDSAAVLSVDFGWSDVGNWDSVWEMLDHDEAGNATQGTVVIHNSRNSLVRSEELHPYRRGRS